MLHQVVQQERRDGLPHDAVLPACVQRLGQHPVVQGGIQLILLRYGVGDDQRRGGPAQGLPGPHHLHDLLGRTHRPVDGLARTAQIEAGEVLRAVAEHPDPEGLQALQRGRDVQDRLHAGAHHRDVGAGEQPEIRGLVLGRGPVPVHAAEAAGREDAQACAGREERGRGHGRRPARTGRQRRCEVAVPELPHRRILGDPLQLVLVQADMAPSVQYGDGRGDGARGSHELLQLFRDPSIPGAWQAVGDDRRLQGHDGAVRGEGFLHLDGEDRFVRVGAVRCIQ